MATIGFSAAGPIAYAAMVAIQSADVRGREQVRLRSGPSLRTAADGPGLRQFELSCLQSGRQRPLTLDEIPVSCRRCTSSSVLQS
jgi:hypothetical protein